MRWRRSTHGSSTCRSSWRRAAGEGWRAPVERLPACCRGSPRSRPRPLGSQPMDEPEPSANALTPAAPEPAAAAPAPSASPAVRATRARSLPTPGAKRATVIGAGSFGTALAVLLARGGLRTTLQARTAEQAASLAGERENRVYLPGVELPAQLRIEAASAGVARADYV